MKYDIVIKNGLIVDGTGKEKYHGDIGIIGEKIERVGLIDHLEATRFIDAKGKIVCPGFIDPHSHADVSIMFYPDNEACIMQGVTTFIGGNCGDSSAPVGEYWDAKALDLEKIKGVIPSYYTWYNSPIKRDDVVRQAWTQYNLDLDYKSFEEFCEKLDKYKISTNYYPLIGHGNLRSIVMRGDISREASFDEIREMKTLLRSALQAGAKGISTGLDYPPGAFASIEELISLAQVVKEFDGIYATHIRGRKLFVTGEGGYDPERGLIEAFQIAETTGVSVHISHLIMIKSPEYTKSLFDNARKKGIKVTYDVIANTTAGGGSFPFLAFILKPWYLTAGSPEQFEKNLNDKDYVDAMKKDMGSSKWYFANHESLPGVEEAILITKCKNSSYINKTVKQIMEERDWSYADTLINIAKSDALTKIKYGAPSKEEEHNNIKALFDYPWSMPSSDGFAVNHDSKFGFAEPFCFYPHQNSFNYAVRYLQRYQNHSLEETIRKATGLVAETFKIKGRGTIAEKKYADILIYDPEQLNCNESPFDTRTYPKGVLYVLVNGAIVLDNGVQTGSRPGKVLKI
ncbi:MAG: amidohydrolase family protein [Eubacteriales bacterium]|nr:amidohydrolase family protein [Eubacteriales bacterium]